MDLEVIMLSQTEKDKKTNDLVIHRISKTETKKREMATSLVKAYMAMG